MIERIQRQKKATIFAALGAVALLIILFILALVAAGGWSWFARFLESTAVLWIQAVGPLVAAGIAVYVPYKMRMDEHAAQKEKEARRAMAVLLSARAMLVPLNAFARAAENRLDDRNTWRSGWLVELHLKISSQPLPTDEQVLVLAEQDSDLGGYLAEGKVQFVQLVEILNQLKEKQSDEIARNTPFLSRRFAALRRSFAAASARIDVLLPSGNPGRDTARP